MFFFVCFLSLWRLIDLMIVCRENATTQNVDYSVGQGLLAGFMIRLITEPQYSTVQQQCKELHDAGGSSMGVRFFRYCCVLTVLIHVY